MSKQTRRPTAKFDYKNDNEGGGGYLHTLCLKVRKGNAQNTCRVRGCHQHLPRACDSQFPVGEFSAIADFEYGGIGPVGEFSAIKDFEDGGIGPVGEFSAIEDFEYGAIGPVDEFSAIEDFEYGGIGPVGEFSAIADFEDGGIGPVGEFSAIEGFEDGGIGPVGEFSATEDFEYGAIGPRFFTVIYTGIPLKIGQKHLSETLQEKWPKNRPTFPSAGAVDSRHWMDKPQVQSNSH